jgi:hypothetical protein
MAGVSITRIACVVAVAAMLAQGAAHGAPLPARHFASPDDAVAALIAALQTHDPAKLQAVLGPGSENLVRSGDPVKDRKESDHFLAAYAERHTLTPDGDGRMVLHVGTDDWPLPIPLLQQNGGWHFDSREGAQEIIDRRIGRNEAAAIRFCLAYVDAQKAYFELFQAATGAGAYAQHLVSTPGNYDGLYWPPANSVPESPLTSLVQSAVEEGYPGQIETGHPIPYQGYFFRILTAQGADAPGGAKPYMRDGKLTDGFALIAWPAMYGASGVMTFIVNQDGTVFQRDLGPGTPKQVQAVKGFDPTLAWARVDVDQ